MLDERPRHMMMAKKLFLEVQHGRVENDWEETFISDVYHRLLMDNHLTQKQAVKLESLFERL